MSIFLISTAITIAYFLIGGMAGNYVIGKIKELVS
jgi:hypothetical protein